MGRRALGFSVRTKMLLVLLPLFLIIGVLVAVATSEARIVHRQLARLAEEEREAQLTQSLLVELGGAEAWASRKIGLGGRAEIEHDLSEHLHRAHDFVLALHPEHSDEDPSDAQHQDREERLRTSLLARLVSAESLVDDANWDELARELTLARREVEVLAAETRSESNRSADELDRRVHRLVDMLFLVAGVGILTLIALAWTFQRVVLRPLRLMERATRELGHADGKAQDDARLQRVEIRSRDEFGQLAATFDEMVERIESHRAELERRVTQRTREVIRAARLADLGTLAAGIAHEINNPLASISAGVEGLRREVGPILPSASLEVIDLVAGEVERARDIASRLLQLGRKDEPRREAVWLRHEIASVVTMVRYLAKRRGIEVVERCDADLPPIVGDPGDWRQVLFNILRNAIDAAPDHSEVEVHAGRAERGWLQLRVRDGGAGFPDDALDRVFEPFFSTKAPGHGTGLGLAIVDRIVRDNGGRVRAGNWSGGGEILIEVEYHEA